jgi:hypothetical protein
MLLGYSLEDIFSEIMVVQSYTSLSYDILCWLEKKFHSCIQAIKKAPKQANQSLRSHK